MATRSNFQFSITFCSIVVVLGVVTWLNRVQRHETTMKDVPNDVAGKLFGGDQFKACFVKPECQVRTRA